MSAIAGIFHLNNEPINLQHTKSLMKSLEKYPANDVQIWIKDNVFFGSHSQWITPESIGEQLPYYDYERKLSITADAIIDNRNELFDKLGVDHSERKTMPDSKIILLSYAKWGENVPYHINGSFAFVIWDEKNKKIFGARDFTGSRTLYYCNKNQKFAFCTVMEPLLTLPFLEKKLDEEWLAQFLAITAMWDSVDASSTVIKDIRQIPPSHSFSVVDGRFTITKYERLVLNEKVRYRRDEDYIEAFREIFQESIDSKIRTFRNVGSQLSGGLDSGSVVSFAARTLKKQNKQLNTYSFIPIENFDDWTSKYAVADERPFIKSTVKYVGNIKDHYFSFNNNNPLSEIDEMLDVFEMPFKTLGNGYWIKGLFEKASMDDVGILLGGARGNMTISWGPALDYYGILLKKLRFFKLYREVELYQKNTGIANRKYFYSNILKSAFPFLNNSIQTTDPQSLLINPVFANKTNVYDKLKQYGIAEINPLKVNRIDFRREHFEQDYRLNVTGTAITKLSLRYGLVSRDPTNDIRIINYCLSLPLDQFVMSGMDRALIRRATKGYLPDKVRLNQKVRGIQSADWVQRVAPSWNEFTNELQQLVKDDLVSEFLNIDYLKTVLSQVKDGPQENYAILPEYKMLMRSLIVRRFLKSFKGGDTDEKRMETAYAGSSGY